MVFGFFFNFVSCLERPIRQLLEQLGGRTRILRLDPSFPAGRFRLQSTDAEESTSQFHARLPSRRVSFSHYFTHAFYLYNECFAVRRLISLPYWMWTIWWPVGSPIGSASSPTCSRSTDVSRTRTKSPTNYKVTYLFLLVIYWPDFDM